MEYSNTNYHTEPLDDTVDEVESQSNEAAPDSPSRSTSPTPMVNETVNRVKPERRVKSTEEKAISREIRYVSN